MAFDWKNALGIAGTVVGLGGLASGGSAVSTALGYLNSKKLMDKQYNLAIKGYKESPLAVREGLERAGFNPLLSYASSGNFASTGIGSASAPDIGSSITNGYSTFVNQRKLANAQVNNTNADTTLKNEQSLTEQSKRSQIEFQNAMLDVETHLKRKDLSSYDRRLYTALYEQMQRAENFRAIASLQGYNAETGRISADASQLDAQTRSKWTPAQIVGGVGAGLIGAFGLGKGINAVKTLKNSVPALTGASRVVTSGISKARRIKR